MVSIGVPISEVLRFNERTSVFNIKRAMHIEKFTIISENKGSNYLRIIRPI